MERDVVAVDVEKLGRGPLLRLADGDLFGGQCATDLGGRVVHVTGDDRVFRAHLYTGRRPADLNPMRAIIAFRRGVVVRVNVKRIIRTGLHAGFTSYATVVVKVDDAVFPREEGLNRADADTGSIGAVVASHHGKDPSGVGENTFLHLFDIGSVDPDRDVMLALTSGGTGMTTDTFSIVNNESVFHWLYGFKV